MIALILLCVVGIVYGVAMGKPYGWLGAGLSVAALLVAVVPGFPGN
jgi:hypothetical protein